MDSGRASAGKSRVYFQHGGESAGIWKLGLCWGFIKGL